MNKYQKFTAGDFIADDHFLNWVLNPDTKSDRAWEKWLNQNPHKKEEVEKAVILIRSLKFEESPGLNSFQQSRLLEKINSKIDGLSTVNGESETVKELIPGKIKRSMGYAAGIAASFIVVAFLSYFFLNNFQQKTVQTDFAEKREIVLPDGSSVILNANSELSYSRDWKNESVREVWLEGEAFFEVVKAEDQNQQPQRFVVNSGNLSVEVLGTSFNVGDRRGQTRVTLLEGKVKLENKLDKNAIPLFLRPGEHAEISESNKVIEKSTVDIQKYSSWIDNKLIFEKAELSEIKHVLEDNFGLEVVFEDQSLLHRRFTGVIKTDNIALFLETLELSFGVNVIKENEKIIFQKATN